jgi:hypothetical protein
LTEICLSHFNVKSREGWRRREILIGWTNKREWKGIKEIGTKARKEQKG